MKKSYVLMNVVIGICLSGIFASSLDASATISKATLKTKAVTLTTLQTLIPSLAVAPAKFNELSAGNGYPDPIVFAIGNLKLPFFGNPFGNAAKTDLAGMQSSFNWTTGVTQVLLAFDTNNNFIPNLATYAPPSGSSISTSNPTFEVFVYDTASGNLLGTQKLVLGQVTAPETTAPDDSTSSSQPYPDYSNAVSLIFQNVTASPVPVTYPGAFQIACSSCPPPVTVSLTTLQAAATLSAFQNNIGGTVSKIQAAANVNPPDFVSIGIANNVVALLDDPSNQNLFLPASSLPTTVNWSNGVTVSLLAFDKNNNLIKDLKNLGPVGAPASLQLFLFDGGTNALLGVVPVPLNLAVYPGSTSAAAWNTDAMTAQSVAGSTAATGTYPSIIQVSTPVPIVISSATIATINALVPAGQTLMPITAGATVSDIVFTLSYQDGTTDTFSLNTTFSADITTINGALTAGSSLNLGYQVSQLTGGEYQLAYFVYNFASKQVVTQHTFVSELTGKTLTSTPLNCAISMSGNGAMTGNTSPYSFPATLDSSDMGIMQFQITAALITSTVLQAVKTLSAFEGMIGTTGSIIQTVASANPPSLVYIGIAKNGVALLADPSNNKLFIPASSLPSTLNWNNGVNISLLAFDADGVLITDLTTLTGTNGAASAPVSLQLFIFDGVSNALLGTVPVPLSMAVPLGQTPVAAWNSNAMTGGATSWTASASGTYPSILEISVPVPMSAATVNTINALTPSTQSMMPITTGTTVGDIVFDLSYKDGTTDTFSLNTTFSADITTINTALVAGSSLNVGYQVTQLTSGEYQVAYFVYNFATKQAVTQNTFISQLTGKTLTTMNCAVSMTGNNAMATTATPYSFAASITTGVMQFQISPPVSTAVQAVTTFTALQTMIGATLNPLQTAAYASGSLTIGLSNNSTTLSLATLPSNVNWTNGVNLVLLVFDSNGFLISDLRTLNIASAPAPSCMLFIFDGTTGNLLGTLPIAAANITPMAGAQGGAWSVNAISVGAGTGVAGVSGTYPAVVQVSAPVALTSAQIAQISQINPATGGYVIPVTTTASITDIQLTPVYQSATQDVFDMQKTFPADLVAINKALVAGTSVNLGYQLTQVNGAYQLAYFVSTVPATASATAQVIAQNTFISSLTGQTLTQVNGGIAMTGNTSSIGNPTPFYGIPANSAATGSVTTGIMQLQISAPVYSKATLQAMTTYAQIKQAIGLNEATSSFTALASATTNNPASVYIECGNVLFSFFANIQQGGSNVLKLSKFATDFNWTTGVRLVLVGIDSNSNYIPNLTTTVPDHFALFIYDTATGNVIGYRRVTVSAVGQQIVNTGTSYPTFTTATTQVLGVSTGSATTTANYPCSFNVVCATCAAPIQVPTISAAMITQMNAVTAGAGYIVPITTASVVNDIVFSPVYADTTSEKFSVNSTFASDLALINAAIKAGSTLSMGFQMSQVGGVWMFAYFIYNQTTSALVTQNTFVSQYTDKTFGNINCFVYMPGIYERSPFSMPADLSQGGITQFKQTVVTQTQLEALATYNDLELAVPSLSYGEATYSGTGAPSFFNFNIGNVGLPFFSNPWNPSGNVTTLSSMASKFVWSAAQGAIFVLLAFDANGNFIPSLQTYCKNNVALISISNPTFEMFVYDGVSYNLIGTQRLKLGAVTAPETKAPDQNLGGTPYPNYASVLDSNIPMGIGSGIVPSLNPYPSATSIKMKQTS